MDSLLNRSHSADTATSSVTLPSSLGSSSRNSGAAINSAKRRIDLNTPVINRNGRIEEAGETDDDGRLVDEGGEDDFDAVKDSVKSNDGSLFRRNVTPVRALNKLSAVWKHFKEYPKSLITDPNAFVSEWHKFAVCTHCYDKHYRNDSVTTLSLWEVNYGVTHSTSKLVDICSGIILDYIRKMEKQQWNMLPTSCTLDLLLVVCLLLLLHILIFLLG